MSLAVVSVSGDSIRRTTQKRTKILHVKVAAGDVLNMSDRRKALRDLIEEAREEDLPLLVSNGSVANSQLTTSRGCEIHCRQAAIATANRSDTNAAWPRILLVGSHRICPLRIMFTVSIP